MLSSTDDIGSLGTTAPAVLDDGTPITTRGGNQTLTSTDEDAHKRASFEIDAAEEMIRTVKNLIDKARAEGIDPDEIANLESYRSSMISSVAAAKGALASGNPSLALTNLSNVTTVLGNVKKQEEEAAASELAEEASELTDTPQKNYFSTENTEAFGASPYSLTSTMPAFDDEFGLTREQRERYGAPSSVFDDMDFERPTPAPTTVRLGDQQIPEPTSEYDLRQNETGEKVKLGDAGNTSGIRLGENTPSSEPSLQNTGLELKPEDKELRQKLNAMRRELKEKDLAGVTASDVANGEIPPPPATPAPTASAIAPIPPSPTGETALTPVVDAQPAAAATPPSAETTSVSASSRPPEPAKPTPISGGNDVSNGTTFSLTPTTPSASGMRLGNSQSSVRLGA